MTDIAAAIGIPQLAQANKFQNKRAYIAGKYMDAFKDLPIILPVGDDDENLHSHHLFVIRLKDGTPVSRDDFINIMSEKYKIGCSVHFIPLNLHPFWQEKLGISENDFPLAVKAYKNAISLPIYTKMTDDDIARVIGAVKNILLP
jgi:dTDP-4-amino-4,6-dideoxygalactose transaminase